MILTDQDVKIPWSKRAPHTVALLLHGALGMEMGMWIPYSYLSLHINIDIRIRIQIQYGSIVDKSESNFHLFALSDSITVFDNI